MRKDRIEGRKEDVQTTVRCGMAQYSKTNQSRHPPNAPGCKMQIEQNRRSAAFARGLMRTVSSPVIETATSAQAETTYNRKSQRRAVSCQCQNNYFLFSFSIYIFLDLVFISSNNKNIFNITRKLHIRLC